MPLAQWVAGSVIGHPKLERLALSAVGLHRVLWVARTVADLADAGELRAAHVAEAVQYQPEVACR